jgi:hypothetical protein
VHDFVEEAASFPSGTHDDQVDAMSQALHRYYYMSGKLDQKPDLDNSMEALVRKNIEKYNKPRKARVTAL